MDGGLGVEHRSCDGHAVVTASPEGLSVICGPEQVGVAIWARCPEESFQTWIDGLDPDALPSARIILRPEAVFEAALSVCGGAGMRDTPEREQLCGDIAALAEMFAKITRASYIRLRLDRITGNACRKFHLDALTVRLVCTYRGTGTQYGLASGDSDPTEIFTVGTGSPALLRGTLMPDSDRNPLRHRSPPIEGTGETRLVLILDPIHDPEDEV